MKKKFSEKSNKMKKNDWIISIILCLIFGILAFYNLGINKNPQTFYNFQYNDSVLIELNDDIYVSKLRYFTGENVGEYEVYISEDDENYIFIGSFKGSYEFAWYDYEINSKFKYLKLVSIDYNSYLGEIMLYDEDNNKLNIISSDNGYLLVDEPQYVVDEIGYMNSTYFDELYFARTAYDYVNGLPASEWTHPPLAKLIQAIPIYFIGMTPFAYRLTSVIFGMLLVLTIYYFAKLIFKNRLYATFAGLLITFENFHLVQSRIGTTDSMLILFMVLSSLFMYKYICLDEESSFKIKVINLFLSGLFFGLSISVKWTGFYLGLGICIAFFVKFIFDLTTKNRKDYLKIIPLCIIFYIVIPCLIYSLSYFLFPNMETRMVNNFSSLILQIKDMYQFHSTLDASHPFSSKWYTWPIMYKPVWYHIEYLSNGLKSTIAAIGNSAIWWFGIFAFIYLVISGIRKLDRDKLYLVTIILCLFLPYAFIGRVMFLYHYYPVIPFLILGITMFIKYINDKVGRTWIMYAYLIVVTILFFIFYPVTTGIPVSTEYVDSLKWFSSWIF